VGLLDEDFFMYGEDIDLSYRLLKGGWQNWYLPFDIIHYKGESTEKTSFRYVHVFYQAMLIFFRKHYSHLSLLLAVPVKTAIYFSAFLALVKMIGDKFGNFVNPSTFRRDD
jgi:GT2 family glycosyltransferase